ncbi:insertion element protein [Pontibacillus sp. ALD_SL1]|uniref:insertion element protein n=1 Tax=Pontibacillus sp. ALD_SL1 TaxID=2777185 RepID=UPI001A961AB6|nr:insertion element protein [Pontibacillus sp. ALD_SL1]QST00397.1 insertion element protein [Pontibacillus sp. ALD_SL1]
MAKLKRLATSEDTIVEVAVPVSNEEIKDRQKQYDLLKPKKFATRYNDMLYKPVSFNWNGLNHTIQYNHCNEPFCKWLGEDQHKYETVKGKPSRYRLFGSSKSRSKTIRCNPDPINPTKGLPTLDCSTVPLSNWAIAEEIRRIVTMETVQDIDPDYNFHKDGCPNTGSSPFEFKKLFYKQGKSSAGSQRWQCKTCKKITNVLPTRKQSTTYNQKRNDILPMFAKLLVNKVPINRACDILEIGSGTYYGKLEWLYRRCLEFLERHEKPAFEVNEFKEIWLNTDKMHYYLNNVRKKGQGSAKYRGLEDLLLPTYIVVTGDVHSRYIIRSDIAYDWEKSFDELNVDTRKFKEDHLNDFCKKNARLDFQHYPQEPSKNDTESKFDFDKKLREIKQRQQYVNGLHVNSTYTTVAHYWLIKQLVKASQWRMVSDKDNSIMTAFYRVFAKEIKRSDAHHFLFLTDRNKSKKEALREFENAKEDLLDWGAHRGYDTKNIMNLAKHKLTEHFKTHSFHETTTTASGYSYREWANSPIEHPIASKDKGFNEVDCTTDLSAYEPKEIAELLLNVNDNAISSFLQQIRRRLSILERPIVTARKDGKSYIYSNFNPKYAQMAITIIRTHYNFCLSFNTKENGGIVTATPAQRLGITDKAFDWNDIIYLR